MQTVENTITNPLKKFIFEKGKTMTDVAKETGIDLSSLRAMCAKSKEGFSPRVENLKKLKATIGFNIYEHT